MIVKDLLLLKIRCGVCICPVLRLVKADNLMLRIGYSDQFAEFLYGLLRLFGLFGGYSELCWLEEIVSVLLARLSSSPILEVSIVSGLLRKLISLFLNKCISYSISHSLALIPG